MRNHEERGRVGGHNGRVELTKHHGLGNDFLVCLVPEGEPIELSGDLARSLCDRRTGIGADGLIYGTGFANVDFGDGRMLSDVDRIMHLFNSDGSRAEMSGNGIRCLAQAIAAERGTDTCSLTISTDGGRRQLEVSPGDSADTVQVRVEMGAAKPGPDHDPARVASALGLSVDGLLTGTADLGNPHLVVMVDDPHAIDVADRGAAIEADFADGCNVHFVRALDRDHLDLVVWERGAGITQACGTGATAAAHAAHGWGLVDKQVKVDMPGGSATVEVADDQLWLTGPATHIARIVL